jgi:hypothetical protein
MGRGLLVAVVLSLAVTAMGVSGCDASSSPELQTVIRCAARAAPLTAPRVARALRKHGFHDVRTTKEDCETEVSGAPSIINRTVKSDDLLFCSIYEPSTSWGHAIKTDDPSYRSSIIWHGTKAYLFYENMECQLYPDEGRANQQMAQLVAAVRDLRGQLRGK